MTNKTLSVVTAVTMESVGMTPPWDRESWHVILDWSVIPQPML